MESLIKSTKFIFKRFFTFWWWWHEKKIDKGGSGVVPDDCNPCRVSTECSNVVLDPAKGKCHVFDAKISTGVVTAITRWFRP